MDVELEGECPVGPAGIKSGMVVLCLLSFCGCVLWFLLKWRQILGVLSDRVFSYVDVDGSGSIDSRVRRRLAKSVELMRNKY